jgi:flagellin-like protein
MAKPAGYRGKRKLKGLEPLIAAIILVAITLVIAIAVVSWTTGLFGATVGRTESLVIFPNVLLRYNGSHWVLNISIRNTGNSVVTVTSINVGTITCFSGATVIAPGGTGSYSLSCGTTGFLRGIRYNIKVVTAAGNTFYSEVIAE